LNSSPAVAIAAQAIGWTLLIAAVGKIGSGNVADEVAAYQMLPGRLVGPAGRLLIALELSAAAGLILAVDSIWFAVAASLLFASFTVGIGVTLRRGRRILCGCFGAGGDAVSGFVLARTLILLSLSLAVARHLLHGDGLRLVTLSELSVVFGVLLILRLMSITPLVISFLRTRPTISSVPTRRMGFRHTSMDSSLFPEAWTSSHPSSPVIEQQH
jgi:hypothetical protein